MVYVFDRETGHLLSEESRRIAELLQEYDPTLELQWIPPENRELDDRYIYAVVHRPVGRKPYIAMRLRDDEMNHTVLTRLFTNDLARNDVLKTLEADNRARTLYEKKILDEEKEERFAFAMSVFGSNKSVYRHGGKRYGR